MTAKLAKRPRAPNQIARLIGDLATGAVPRSGNLERVTPTAAKLPTLGCKRELAGVRDLRIVLCANGISL
jgi:hypothetical protein